MGGWLVLIQNFSVILKMIQYAYGMLENNFMKRDFPVLHIKPADQTESMTNSLFSCSVLDLSRTLEKVDFLFLNI